MRVMFALFDIVYRWTGASRRWARARSVVVACGFALLAVPVILTLKQVVPGWPGWLAAGIACGPLFAWIAYSSVRTWRAAWRAIRGRSHELEHWPGP